LEKKSRKWKVIFKKNKYFQNFFSTFDLRVHFVQTSTDSQAMAETTHNDGEAHPPSLQNVLSDPRLRDAFAIFLRKEFAEENVLFIQVRDNKKCVEKNLISLPGRRRFGSSQKKGG
jgi:hypothetical protein